MLCVDVISQRGQTFVFAFFALCAVNALFKHIQVITRHAVCTQRAVNKSCVPQFSG